nr:PrsW family intramembrane metalloprotease [Janibacter limosus]
MVGNLIFGTLPGALFGADNRDVLTAVISAPLVEETTKGAFLLVMWLLMRREFNGLTDGIVYAGIVAAGFAFTENIQYFAGRGHAAGGRRVQAGPSSCEGWSLPSSTRCSPA